MVPEVSAVGSEMTVKIFTVPSKAHVLKKKRGGDGGTGGGGNGLVYEAPLCHHSASLSGSAPEKRLQLVAETEIKLCLDK